MPSLLDRQRAFQAAVLGGPQSLADSALAILGNGLTVEQRLSIHRNNTAILLGETLAAHYPAVCGLVGEDCFTALARAYLALHPPTAGHLMAYGTEFPGFLDAHALAATLPYLADVARLDWATHDAYHAADAAPCDPAALAAVPPDRLAGLRLEPLPSVRLLRSGYPVAAIRAMSLPDAPPDAPGVDLDRGGDCLLVTRPAAEVLILTLAPGDWILARELAAGVPLGEAATLAEVSDGDFDLGTALARLLGTGVFAGWSVGEDGDGVEGNR